MLFHVFFFLFMLQNRIIKLDYNLNLVCVSSTVCVWGVEGKWDIKGCQTSHMLDTPKQWPTSLNEFNYVSVRSRVTVRPVGRCVHLRQVCTVRHPVGELSCPFCPLRDVLLTSLAPLSSAQLAARGTTTQPDTLHRNYHRLLLVKSGFPNVCLFGVRSWRRWFWLIETVAERLFFCLSFFGVSNLWRVQKKKKKKKGFTESWDLSVVAFKRCCRLTSRKKIFAIVKADWKE